MKEYNRRLNDIEADMRTKGDKEKVMLILIKRKAELDAEFEQVRFPPQKRRPSTAKKTDV